MGTVFSGKLLERHCGLMGSNERKEIFGLLAKKKWYLALNLF